MARRRMHNPSRFKRGCRQTPRHSRYASKLCSEWGFAREGANVKQACIAAATIFASTAAFAETINFDNDAPGSLPSAWQQGVTGKGSPKWAVRQDAGAPSKPNVLQQSGSGAFPWCVMPKTAVENGFVEVRFKPISGSADQAGRGVWRWEKRGHHHRAARHEP